MPHVNVAERRAYEQAYRQRPDYKARRKAYNEANKEKLQAWQKANYEANRESRIVKSFKQHLKATYGIDFLTYSALLIVQAGRCASCSKPMRDPHVDHDHADNKVRGLLCRGCNTAIGHVDDSIPQLLQCVDYLKRFQ